MKILFLILFCAISISCKNDSKNEIVIPPQQYEEPKKEDVKDDPTQRISLYWENTTEPHPERASWSDTLVEILSKNYDTMIKANDTTRICPKFNSFSKEMKIKTLAEFWVAVSYFESSFNPKSESVDVGTRSDKGSWSVGLYQMSANDSSAKAMGVDYQGLKDPVKNILVATEQWRRQINNCGLHILPNSSKCRYWAVLLDGNRYSKVNEIIQRTRKQVPSCI